MTWVPNTVGTGRPIEALPYGVITTPDGSPPRVAVAIGAHALDLRAACEAGLFNEVTNASVLTTSSLTALLAAGRHTWQAVRSRITELLSNTSYQARVEPFLLELADCTNLLPIQPGDYVDFYSSRQHAEHCGRIMRPETPPLPPNWLSLPAGYHGRAGSIVVDGTPIQRPRGQYLNDNGAAIFDCTAKLDYELELGFVVGGAATQGVAVATSDVRDRVFGVVLVNDWSARDFQSWEAKPIGPFLSKSFATSISRWVLPLDALEQCRVDGPAQHPAPLQYLEVDEPWALDMELSVAIKPHLGDRDIHVSTVNSSLLYWNCAQQLAHLTINGASLRPGDLFASGTISGEQINTQGCLLEISENGTRTLELDGHSRTFLEDGDEVIMNGHAMIGGDVRIDLGPVRGQIQPGEAVT